MSHTSQPPTQGTRDQRVGGGLTKRSRFPSPETG
jgi:hypothetical protein